MAETSTETLRRLLDERGVEHYDRFDVTEWVGSDGEICHTNTIYSNGATVFVLRKCTTPEQAIAATLGDVPRLPYFWTADGTLHIELPRLPESISVRLPDQRDREVGSARTWQYTQGSGTCHVECFDDGVDEGLDGEPIFSPPTWYLSCGHTTQDSERPNFCPVCGRVADA